MLESLRRLRSEADNADRLGPALAPVATACPKALVVWPPLEPISAPASTPAMEAMLMKRIWSMRLATWRSVTCASSWLMTAASSSSFSTPRMRPVKM